MMVWAFNSVNESEIGLIYDSIKKGKSRFGWSWEKEHNLKLPDNWTEEHSRQLFLLEIKQGDWIVHINTPEWGKCIVGEVVSEYDFDEGLQLSDGSYDFRHNFSIDTASIIEFERANPNVLPRVNLCPRTRFHRVYAVTDFCESIENLKNNKINLNDNESSGERHLKDKTKSYLKEISDLIHEMHKGKKLEHFLAKVIRQVPGVVSVKENGSRWGTDHGADLIVTLRSAIDTLEFENKIIVQVKSFEGKHYDLDAVDQIKTGIEKYEGAAGMLITTAESTGDLKSAIKKLSKSINKPIRSLCGAEVAQFVIKHAPELLFDLDE